MIVTQQDLELLLDRFKSLAEFLHSDEAKNDIKIIDFIDKNIVLDTEDVSDVYKEHDDQRQDVTAGIITVNEARKDR